MLANPYSPAYSTRVSNSSVVGGRDKRVHAIDRVTGKQVWTFATKQKVDSSPVICGDKVVVGSEDARIYILALADGKELWSYELGGGVVASPAVCGGRIVIGTDEGKVYCFGEQR